MWQVASVVLNYNVYRKTLFRNEIIRLAAARGQLRNSTDIDFAGDRARYGYLAHIASNISYLLVTNR